ncbi:hypothetical protein EIP86_006137 [Pleurotus ostreatoroseus]|nr:hypothetical protein EIP86_006137 [Pleurotus ostreatoroseus]
MLAHLPPTPDPPPEPFEDEPPEEPAPPQPRSPRKSVPRTAHSPRKAIPVGNGKKRAVRRSLGGAGPASPKGKSKVIPAFETEVVPPSPSFGGPPAFKTTLSAVPGPAQLQLPPAFVLPPPSPAAQLPPRESLLSTALIPPASATEADIPRTGPSQSSRSGNKAPSRPVGSSASAQPQASSSQGGEQPQPAVPSTPSASRPFPLAKPLAMNMIHAYSPVKPSPLSRILMMANSPDSPPGPRLHMAPLTEEDESSPDTSPTPGEPGHAFAGHMKLPAMSLAAELGLPEEDADENPLLDKKPKSRADPRALGADRTKSTSSRTRTAAPVKEKRPGPLVSSRAANKGTVKTARPAASAKSSTVPTTTAAPPRVTRVGPSKGGPRRVPIDSAEAAPIPKVWKG